MIVPLASKATHDDFSTVGKIVSRSDDVRPVVVSAGFLFAPTMRHCLIVDTVDRYNWTPDRYSWLIQALTTAFDTEVAVFSTSLLRDGDGKTEEN